MREGQRVHRLPPIRAIRLEKGLSLRRVARESGVDPAHLSRVERGEASLSISSLNRIAKALELDELTSVLSEYDNEVVAA